jgi:hypothetical protein
MQNLQKSAAAAAAAAAIVVVFNAQAPGAIPFVFQHPSIILQVMKYSQSLEVCNLKDASSFIMGLSSLHKTQTVDAQIDSL